MIILVCILCAYSVISTIAAYRYARMLMRFEDDVDPVMDELEELDSALTKILSTPLFYDSLEIRRVLDVVRKTKLVIRKTARIIASDEEENGEKEEITVEDQALLLQRGHPGGNRQISRI